METSDILNFAIVMQIDLDMDPINLQLMRHLVQTFQQNGFSLAKF